MSDPTELESIYAGYLAALLIGDRESAQRIAREAVAAGVPPLDIYCDVIQRSLHEIGRLWQQNEISVASEHMATAIAESTLAVLQSEAPIPEPRFGLALISGVSDEFHQIGAVIVASALELDGWDVRFLGTDLPADAIVATMSAQRPHLVGFSATMSTTIDRVAELIAQTRALSDASWTPYIVVGGKAFLDGDDLWRRVGADALGRDARSAVELAGQVRGSVEADG
ncbi:MAG: B12-binding domain-containing protein [Gaiellaceae bacterium]|jgi:methanogenic corrinoid protein MtbC1